MFISTVPRRHPPPRSAAKEFATAKNNKKTIKIKLTPVGLRRSLCCHLSVPQVQLRSVQPQALLLLLLRVSHARLAEELLDDTLSVLHAVCGNIGQRTVENFPVLISHDLRQMD